MAHVWNGRLAGFLVFGAIGGLVLPSDALANGTSNWNGSQSSDWFEAENWDGGIVPSGNDVAINQAPNAVISGGGSAETAQVIIGDSVGQTGRLVVEGVGSTLATDPAKLLIIGLSGSGEMTVRNGGSVSTGGGTFIAAFPDGVGTATIRDAGSTLFVGDELAVGREGTGSMAILNGGRVESEEGFIGRNMG